MSIVALQNDDDRKNRAPTTFLVDYQVGPGPMMDDVMHQSRDLDIQERELILEQGRDNNNKTALFSHQSDGGKHETNQGLKHPSIERNQKTQQEPPGQLKSRLKSRKLRRRDSKM